MDKGNNNPISTKEVGVFCLCPTRSAATVVYSHVLNRGGRGVRSKADSLRWGQATLLLLSLDKNKNKPAAKIVAVGGRIQLLWKNRELNIFSYTDSKLLC